MPSLARFKQTFIETRAAKSPLSQLFLKPCPVIVGITEYRELLLKIAPEQLKFRILDFWTRKLVVGPYTDPLFLKQSQLA